MDESQNTRITVTLPSSVVELLDAYAAGRRWSRSTAAAALIETCLKDTAARMETLLKDMKEQPGSPG